jgi:hypothetical protein
MALMKQFQFDNQKPVPKDGGRLRAIFAQLENKGGFT